MFLMKSRKLLKKRYLTNAVNVTTVRGLGL